MATKRGNQSTEELRRVYRTLSPSERLRRGLELTRRAYRLREAGRRAQR